MAEPTPVPGINSSLAVAASKISREFGSEEDVLEVRIHLIHCLLQFKQECC